MKTFEQYIAYRVEKFGEQEKASFRKIEDNLFEYDKFLAINSSASLSNVCFRLLCSHNGKYIYKNF